MVIFSYYNFLSLLFLDSTSKITKFCASRPESAEMVGFQYWNFKTRGGLTQGLLSCHVRQEIYIVIAVFQSSSSVLC